MPARYTAPDQFADPAKEPAMHPYTYECLAHEHIDTIRRDAAATAPTLPTGPPKVPSRTRRTLSGAVLAFALGGFVGSTAMAAGIDRAPAAVTAQAGDPGPTAPIPSVNVADDPGYGDGFGSGRRLLPGRGL
jgi:hypothetical protein